MAPGSNQTNNWCIHREMMKRTIEKDTLTIHLTFNTEIKNNNILL